MTNHSLKMAQKTLAIATFFTALVLVTTGVKAACKPFTVYTKNIQRSVTPGGPDGPLGDLVIANGLIYERPSDSEPSIGTFDLSAITTSTDGVHERRQVSIETSFNKTFILRLAQSKNLCGISRSVGAGNFAPTDDVNLTGVETYPTGGGILTNPIIYGIAAGTGRFVGTEGSVLITYDPSTQFFRYVFTLLPH